MFKPQLKLVPKQQEEIIQFPAKADTTTNISVNKVELDEALRESQYVSNTLNNVDNLDDLDWQEMLDLCRTSYRIVKILSSMIERKEEIER